MAVPARAFPSERIWSKTPLARGRAPAPAARDRRALFLCPRCGSDAQADRHLLDPDHRRGADRHRPGLRVRLFRHAGLQGAQGRGLSGRPGQLQSGDHHDRPGSGGRDLYRADHARDRRQDHREGTLCRSRRLRAVADHGRADRAQHRAVAAQNGRAGEIRRHHDRRHRRRHRQGRGPQAVPRGDDQDRARDAALASDQDADPGARSARRYRAAGHHPAVVHARRHRRRHRLQQGGIHRDRRARHRRLADLRSADRGIGARLERIRDGGGARQERQLHHRLLDRKHRSDGRAYRRFDHHRAGADADRQRISDHARRLDRGVARDRGGDRRLQRAVRGQPGRRPARRDRDESAGVAIVGAGVEGHRLSDRQGRGETGRRLYARRNRKRHHRRRHAGFVRADHRLHRHQNSALCLREVSRRRAGAHHVDEIGRRGDGDRAHFCREPAEGAAVARNRAQRTGRDRHPRARRRRRQERHSRRARHPVARRHPQSGAGHAAWHERRRHSQRLQDRSMVFGADPRHRRHGGGDPRQRPAAIGAGLAPAQSDGLFRCAARAPDRARCRNGVAASSRR